MDDENNVARRPRGDAKQDSGDTGSARHTRHGRVARQLARRRRQERLAGILIAVVGVAVLVIAIVALRNPKRPATAAGTRTGLHSAMSSTLSGGPSGRPSRSGGGSTAPPGSTGPSSVPSGRSSGSLTGALPLIVLNNTTISGLAAQAAHRFEAGGWTVTRFGNLTNNILSTVAYYDPSVAKAKPTALALQRQYPTIKRVVPKFPELPAGPIVVVLTPDYSP